MSPSLKMSSLASVIAVLLLATTAPVSAFAPPSKGKSNLLTLHPSAAVTSSTRQPIGRLNSAAPPLFALQPGSDDEDEKRTIKASAREETPMILDNDDSDTTSNPKSAEEDAAAKISTINERLLTELQTATDKEKYGVKTGMGKKLGLSGGRPKKTPAEMEASLAEARDLNGVNPVIAVTGGLFAFTVAAGLWWTTNQLGSFFAMHPVQTEVYFVQRLASVFRNVVMGLASLASGFFGVTGMGIFLLGIKVFIGISKGELDPTPIVRRGANGGSGGDSSGNKKMPDVWELMTGQKPKRRGGRGSSDDDNNLFGL